MIGEIATLAAVVVAAIGLLLTAQQLRIQNRQRLLELGNFYIARYWQIDDDLLLTKRTDEAHKGHRHRYLRLCEDEYDAARAKWLDSEQWAIWHMGLVGERSRELLEDDLSVRDPKLEAFVSLRTCLAQVERQGEPHSSERCDSLNLTVE